MLIQLILDDSGMERLFCSNSGDLAFKHLDSTSAMVLLEISIFGSSLRQKLQGNLLAQRLRSSILPHILVEP